jgi:addiction module antidote protein, HigA family
MSRSLSPVHPGEVLLEEFMKPMSITQYRLAKETAVPARRINEIVHRDRSITADTALRLAKFFGTSEMFWLNLQARYDLDMQREKLGLKLHSVRPFASMKSAAPPVERSARRLVVAAKRGSVRSGYGRKTS